jgi:GrpB-like predicted nucleotidyltransferase (UPF0157 family)
MERARAEIDEAITIEDYDPAWPILFEQERHRVASSLGNVVTRVEHFGSTAVPGMAGKPIVDVLVGVNDLALASSRIASLEALGYENFGEVFIPGRVYLRRRGPRHFNIAMTAAGSQFWNEQILLRDYLRRHPDEAEAYANEKRASFAGGARMFSTYSQAKAPFLSALLERARSWHAGRR